MIIVIVQRESLFPIPHPIQNYVPEYTKRYNIYHRTILLRKNNITYLILPSYFMILCSYDCNPALTQ